MSAHVWGSPETQLFNSLSPDKVLNAVDGLKLNSTARVMQLTSMENRVYEVEIDNPHAKTISENFVIIKFYRPGRWSKEQIQDEHNFLFDLIEYDIPVIAPLKFDNQSVFTNEDGLFFCLFPKKGGRACVEWSSDLLKQMGRLLARLHTCGRIRQAKHRLKLDINTFGEKNLELIVNSSHLPADYQTRYVRVCEDFFKLATSVYKEVHLQRIHGDCHHGNILLNEARPFLIDFDDMSVGPCVQDLWMITPGRDEHSRKQRDILINAYFEMSDFDLEELRFIEILRTLRIIHFSAWIGHRFEDQAFKRVFPHYGTSQYWEREIFDLNSQLQFIQNDSASSSYNC